jgi:hypothetical protein
MQAPGSMADYLFMFSYLSDIKGTVSKLTVKFCICQNCRKMKDYNYKITTSAVE